jgi:purine-nucleoside phosphorylase
MQLPNDRKRNMDHGKRKAAEAARFISERSGMAPEIAVLTGTGLGDSASFLNRAGVFEYGEIPHFPVSTVQSHHGKLVLGRAGGMQAMVFQGRFHLYEGYTARQVAFPIRVMREMGVKTVVLSNASGGLNPAFSPGDIMVVSDHVNLTGENPLVGPNEDGWGERFPDMAFAYDPKLSALAYSCAKENGFPIRKGVYAGLKGPSLETPAEVRFLRTIGADAVGFSTVQEVIAAVHSSIRVLGLSVVTNVHDPDNPAPSNVEEIIAVAEAAAPKLQTIIEYVVENIDERSTG